MAFVEKTDEKVVRVTMTDYGKEKLLSEGIYNTFINFSLSDSEIVYWLCVEPNGILEISGSHKDSTDKTNDRFKYRI